MFGAVDATLRPLKIPSKFVPYMEKHRIYELFHELATGLIIHQPTDHILYLKQSLRLAAKKRDSPRLILIGDPYVKMLILAENIQKKMGLRPITLADICNVSANEIPIESIGEQQIVKNFRIIMKKMAAEYNGWILVDFPRTKKEARAIQRAGIIPTHVLEIKTSYQNRCEKQGNNYERENNLRDLREVYDDLLIRIEAGDRSTEALAEACTILAKRKKHCGAPCVFRVALIGPRGSPCYDSAKYLSHRFNLVHVDFDEILEQTRLQENLLGKTLKMIEYRWGEKRPEAETRIRVVEKYLLGQECTKRGWVLTGYPLTLEDFELLDTLPTPPNRVIFVSISGETLFRRLTRCDVAKLDETNLRSSTATLLSEASECVPPSNQINQIKIQRDLEEYENNVKSLLNYAGESGEVLDGNVNERNLIERMEACLMRPARCAPARRPRFQRKKEILEYEPDDRPDHRILNEIRSSESVLSLF